MINLDDINQIKALDKSNMAGSIEQLTEQIQQTWSEANQLIFPEDYKTVNKIVFSGMGGSALGAYVAKHLYSTKLKQSFEIVNDYHLPEYTDEKTLVIVGSYSGNTEEAVSCFGEAREKKAKIAAISANGTLESLAEKAKIPFYKINPQFNPSNQPRMGIGYSVFSLLTILARLQFIRITDLDISQIKGILARNNTQYGLKTPEKQNPAKQLAKIIYNKIPIFIAGESLIGAVHAIRNQMNENAKCLAVYFPLPELNHHLLEALKFPAGIKNQDHYVLFNSDFYSEKIKKRLSATYEVIKKNGHPTSLFTASGKSPLSQVIESINFGSYAGYYLAMLYGTDPSPITQVEDFKKKLSFGHLEGVHSATFHVSDTKSY